VVTWTPVPLLITAAVYAIFGIFVFTKLKGRANRFPYTLWTITTVVWHLAGAILFLKPSPPIAVLCVKIGYTGVVFIPIALLHFCATYLESRRLKRWIPVGYAAATFFAVTVWIDGILLNGYYDQSWGYCPKASWLHPFFVAAVAVQVTLFIWHLTLKLRDAQLSPARREQVRFIRRGLLWYSAAGIDFLINYGVPYYPPGFLCSLIALGNIAYAVVRHQLLDIQVIIRRTAVYSVASAVLASAYVGILFFTVQMLRPFLRGDSSVGVIIACAITALCHPLIRRVQREIDRALGRGRLDHGMELMKFSTALGQDHSVERTRDLLGQIIEEAFKPGRFAVYRRSSEGYDLFIQHGLPRTPEFLDARNDWFSHFEEKRFSENPSGMVGSFASFPSGDLPVRAAAPLVSRKRLQGFILLGEKSSEEPYTERDLILLKILANQAAVALERPQLIKEVGSEFAHEIKTPLANIAMPAELSFLELQDLIRGSDKDPADLLPTVMKRLEYIVDQAINASTRVDAMQQRAEGGQHGRELERRKSS
jgi:hypothetical protein